MCKKLILSIVVTLVLVASSAQADLVGHWALDDGSGNVAHDSSGNGNDGTLVGDPQWVAGKVGGALEFDGVGSIVDVPYSPEMTPDDGATISAWVFPTDSSRSCIVGQFEGYGMALMDGLQLKSVYWGGDWVLSDVTIPEQEWSHLAMTWDVANSQRTVFLNGEIVGEQGDAVIPAVQNNFGIGLWVGWPASWGDDAFMGAIDDARLYNHVLTEGEVVAAMAAEAYPFALAMAPQDSSMIEQTQYTLKWKAGDFAASHVVYIGESFDEVDQGLVETVDTTQASLSTGSIPAYVAGLTPGQTYYWRVDEVNDLHPESPWKGNVWSFWVQPLTAWEPSPADGMKYVRTDQQLSWEKGMGALFHYVYFGESFEEVDTATGSTWMTPTATFDPGALEIGKTYYWRIDEFAGTATHKGPVWSFTTLPDIAVTDPDLVGWWTLDEGMGTLALDWSGNGNHGTINGGAQWVDGYHGGALEFGPGKYVDCGPDAAADVADDFTLAAWTRLAPGNAGVYGGIGGRLTNVPGAGEYMGFSIVRHSSNIYRLWVGDGTADLVESAVNSDAQYIDTEWHHVAGVREGQTNALYIDGVRQAASSNTGLVPNPEFFHIGRQYSHLADRYFPGVIDDVRIYSKALAETELAEVMRGDPLLAGSPNPGPGAVVDIRDATALSWAAGDTAASHDVYFGTDKGALELQGNQPGTSLSLAGLVEMGGGDYFWRIDEVEAAGTVQTGYVWKFTVPDYLVVEDFEGYSNEVGSRPFEKWIDGVGFTLPEPGNPGNGTGAAVGHDIWSVDSPYLNGQIMEIGNANSDGQAMPIYYAGGLSEADRTFVPAQNWTVEGVTTLVVHFRGATDNAGALYVKINGVKVPYNGEATDIAGDEWIAWEIDLASVGVSLTNVTTLTIGVEGGDTGVLYIDDIIVTKS